MVATKTIREIPSFQLETLPEKQRQYPFYLVFVKWAFNLLGRLFPRQAARQAYKLFATPRTRAIHKTSDELLESARVYEVLYGKTMLKAYEWGKGDRVALLVHGWESRGTAMRSFVPGLLKEGFRVVAFDGPAHGNSGGKMTNLPDFAGAVLAMIRQTGPVQAIITHSFGGATSVHALAHLDNSLHLPKLVLIGVPASTRKVIQNFTKLISLPPRAVAEYFKIIHQKTHGLPFKELDVEHALDRAHVDEVLVVHDKHDSLVPFDSAEAVFHEYGHVSLLVTHGLGHYLLMKNKEVIRQVVEFVAASPND